MTTNKRLLPRHEVKAAGNCNVLDNTSILYAVKDSAAVRKVRTDVADISTICRYDLEIRQTPIRNDHDYIDAPNFNHLSTYKVAAVDYIACYVLKMVKKCFKFVKAQKSATRMLNRTGSKLPGLSNIIPAIQSVVFEAAVQKGVFSSLQDRMYSVSQSALPNAS